MNAPCLPVPEFVTAPPAVAGARHPAEYRVLRSLLHGPRVPRELPHRWPLIRLHLPALLADLESRGLVARGRHDGMATVRLTAAGRRAATGR